MNYLQIFLGFGFLIFVHELGHFLVARWCGVRCPQFAIGFGQALFSWRKGLGFRVGSTEKEYQAKAAAAIQAERDSKEKTEIALKSNASTVYRPEELLAAADRLGLGETEYRFNWIPLGGYVKMLGQEDLDPAKRSSDPRAFNNQLPWKRAAILVAGVVMNLIFGAILATAAFRYGVMSPVPEISWTEPGMPAANAVGKGHAGESAPVGLRPGDEVTFIDGEAINDFIDLRNKILMSAPNESLEFTVKRGSEILTYTVTPEKNEASGVKIIGMPPAPLGREVEKNIPLNAALNQAGIADGDVWNGVDGVATPDWASAVAATVAKQGRKTEFNFGSEADKIGSKKVSLYPVFDAQLYAQLGFRSVIRAGAIEPGTPADRMGMKVGDLIAQVAGKDWPSLEEMPNLVAECPGPVAVTVLRDGHEIVLSPVPAVRMGRLRFLPFGRKKLGVFPEPAWDVPMLGSIAAEYPGPKSDKPTVAAGCNIPRGSRLLRANDVPITHWNDLQRALSDGSSTLVLHYEPNIGTDKVSETVTLALPTDFCQRAKANHWLPPQEIVLALKIKQKLFKCHSMIEAGQVGISRTQDTVVNTYLTLLRLVQGQVSAKNISSIIGIVGVGAQVADEDFGRFLFLLAVISVNLAVMNLLPLPILDGGHLVFLAYEKIRGKPLPVKVMEWSLYVGLVLIGSLMLFAMWNDISRIFFG